MVNIHRTYSRTFTIIDKIGKTADGSDLLDDMRWITVSNSIWNGGTIGGVYLLARHPVSHEYSNSLTAR